jgi:hypothetical protein
MTRLTPVLPRTFPPGKTRLIRRRRSNGPPARLRTRSFCFETSLGETGRASSVSGAGKPGRASRDRARLIELPFAR